MHTRLILLLALTLNVSHLKAQELQGAEAVLKQLPERTQMEKLPEHLQVEKPVKRSFLGSILNKLAGIPEEPEKRDDRDSIAQLQPKLQAFRQESATLSPEEAAAQWLVLYDEYNAIPERLLNLQPNPHDQKLGLKSLLEVLPPPQAWSALTTAIKNRATIDATPKNATLVVLANVLLEDSTARKLAMQKLQSTVKGQKLYDFQLKSIEEAITTATEELDRLTSTDEEKVTAFEQKLARLEDKNIVKEPRELNEIAMPDLVQLGGKEKATSLILRSLKLGIPLQVEGNLTRRLTAQVALAHLDDLKTPLWDLVQTTAELSLYEAMAAKFTEKKDDRNRSSADTFYLLDLIAKNKIQEASLFTLETIARYGPESFPLCLANIENMQQQGFGTQVHAFLEHILAQNPSLPFWDIYIALSARQGAAENALVLVQNALKKPELVDPFRTSVQKQYCTALLAADRVDEGLEILRALIKRGPMPPTDNKAGEIEILKAQWKKLGGAMPPQLVESYRNARLNSANDPTVSFLKSTFVLTDLGRLLDKPELVQEGLAAAKKALPNIPVENYYQSVLLTQLVKNLVAQNQTPDAESLVLAELIKSANETSENRFRQVRNLNDQLTALVWIYHQANRPADVLRVLNDSAWWSAPDLSTLYSLTFDKTPLLLMAAEALEKEGQKEAALKIAKRLVQSYPNKDSSYPLLFRLHQPAPLEELLDTLALRNRFEERPLIWKAQLQLDAGKIEEAEKTIRAAIAIDPSDGEQGKGDRMRAYSVLADILLKKGDPEQSKTMSGAVKAIRLSENADDWWSAGLLTRAVKMYEEALLHFADAYCIQARLALRYNEIGDDAKAELHYQRAFELMPESFGRIESHCFGCEGAFQGKRAQNVAEKVFSKLALTQPNRPQVFYLLGYLRHQQKRYQEAADLYRRAVKLDPDYYNAWSKFYSLSSQLEIPKAERDHAVMELFRLDPHGRQSGSSSRKFTHLSKLWQLILTSEQTYPKLETSDIYPLSAVKAIWDKRSPNEIIFSSYSFIYPSPVDLRSQFTQNDIIEATVRFMEAIKSIHE